MPRVVLNGESVTLPDARSVADALRAAGIHLPTLCHDERLAPAAVCRLCLVRIEGTARPVPACATALTEGLRIDTMSEDLEAARRGTLALLASRYPGEAVRAAPDKPFHKAIVAYGLGDHLNGETDSRNIDRSHPFVTVDMSRCIQCARCVRICDEVQGGFVWHLRDRGAAIHIEPDGPRLLASSCVSCGACVDTCPTGALEDATVETLGSPNTWTRTVCPYCGVGCEVSAGTRDGKIVSVKPVRHSAVSKGHLCVKGRYAFEYISAGDRVTEPMIREKKGWRQAGWDEALAFAATGLRRVLERDGPDAVGVLGSARQTNEENYLTQKFARVVVGTNNVDCCARVCHAPSSTALKRALGAGLATNSFDDIERAGAILVCGANPTENHAVVGARIKQAVRCGAKLIVIDPRRIELARYADCYLPVRPGANIPLLNAMAHVILREHLADLSFIEDRVADYNAFAQSVKEWPPERVADVCGVDAADIRAAARLYATTRPAIIISGLGVTEHIQGVDGVTALINLALLTGNIGKPGSGVNPLRGQNNVQGAAHLGCEPATLPGGVSIEAGRPSFEPLWETTLPPRRGLRVLEMLSAAAAGRLKVLWAIGYDVLLTNPNAQETRNALAAMELVIIQDLFMTETAREFGSVFLPACSSFEKDGTFMNAERRIQLVRQVLVPAGASKPDWQIICELAGALGHTRGFSFGRVEQIWNEIRTACGGARGMTYGRLHEGGLQWPCPDESHAGTQVLHLGGFASGTRARLQAIHYEATSETTTPKYPFVLTTGRSLYEFNAGTMTGRSRTRQLRPADLLDMSPGDAAACDVADGDVVRLVSRYGSADIRVHLNSRQRQGELFATFHTAATFLNAITSRRVDPATGTPEYKLTAVAVEKV